MYNQLAIAIFGVTAIFLSQQKNSELQRYGCIFGLAAQPFWFYTSYQSQQWGFFWFLFVMPLRGQLDLRITG